MAFEAGVPRPENSGRKKGSINKATAEIKAMIETALTEAGGKDYFVRQAEENPVAFMGLIAKILPKQIDATVTGDVVIKEIKRVIIDNADDTDSESI
jgi:hypothetical protein